MIYIKRKAVSVVAHRRMCKLRAIFSGNGMAYNAPNT